MRHYYALGFGGGIKGVRLGRDEVGGPCIRLPSAALGEFTRLLDGGVLTTKPHATPRVGGGICGHGSAGLEGSPPLSFSFTRLARRPAFAGFCACRRNRSASDQRICKANKRRCRCADAWHAAEGHGGRRENSTCQWRTLSVRSGAKALGSARLGSTSCGTTVGCSAEHYC